jgi:urease accessory protein
MPLLHEPFVHFLVSGAVLCIELTAGQSGLLAQWLPAFPIPALLFLILGTLVATDLHLPPAAVTVLAIGLGLVHGCLNGVTIRQAGVWGLLGIMAALFVLVTLVAACVVALQRPWTRVVVRVAGSWIAAMGLLMLGWSLRGGN